jgi:hypothetical protein
MPATTPPSTPSRFDEDILSYTVSDEALEAAAGTERLLHSYRIVSLIATTAAGPQANIENPKKEFAMNDQTDHLDQAEQEILTRVAELDQAEEKLLSRDVSDEVLEMSARPCALGTMGPGSCVVPGGMIC